MSSRTHVHTKTIDTCTATDFDIFHSQFIQGGLLLLVSNPMSSVNDLVKGYPWFICGCPHVPHAPSVRVSVNVQFTMDICVHMQMTMDIPSNLVFRGFSDRGDIVGMVYMCTFADGQ